MYRLSTCNLIWRIQKWIICGGFDPFIFFWIEIFPNSLAAGRESPTWHSKVIFSPTMYSISRDWAFGVFNRPSSYSAVIGYWLYSLNNLFNGKYTTKHTINRSLLYVARNLLNQKWNDNENWSFIIIKVIFMIGNYHSAPLVFKIADIIGIYTNRLKLNVTKITKTHTTFASLPKLINKLLNLLVR